MAPRKLPTNAAVHAEDPYYERPPLSHGAYSLGAAKAGAGHLPRAFWVENRLVAERRALAQARFHRELVQGAKSRLQTQGLSKTLPKPFSPSQRNVSSVQVTIRHSTSDRPGGLQLVIPLAAVEEGTPAMFDISHPSNVGWTFELLRPFDGKVLKGYPSVVPPGYSGAHLRFSPAAGDAGEWVVRASGTLTSSADGTLDVLQEPLKVATARREQQCLTRPAPAHLDVDAALAVHEGRVKRRERLAVAARQRREIKTLVSDRGDHRRPVWNSRPRSASELAAVVRLGQLEAGSTTRVAEMWEPWGR